MTGQFPQLRARIRKRKSGRVTTYYFYDQRRVGKADIPLGTDYDEAIKKWNEIHNRLPRITGTLEEAFAAWEIEEERGLPSYKNKETARSYAKHLRMLRPALQAATWDAVDMPAIASYLRARTAKTQANREMALLSIIWNWARLRGYTALPWPAAGMERSKWKNPEKARKVKVLDAIWNAIRAEGDQVLQDCMDLASATGMRLTDCITVLLPKGDTLHLEASKTGKEAEWDLSLSESLPGLLARRRSLGAAHLMLLSTPGGKPVTLRMLRDRWDIARARAATKAGIHEDLDAVRAIRAMYLRDARKRAAQMAGDLREASDLLQHSDQRLTERHYGGVRRLKPVA